MTPDEHRAEALKWLSDAGDWMDADHGWKGNLSSADRLAYRTADLATAQVHATLATIPAPTTLVQNVTTRPVRIDQAAARRAAELLENIAIGDEGEQRQITIDRLIAHTHWAGATIATEARAIAQRATSSASIEAVEDAIKMLGLDTR